MPAMPQQPVAGVSSDTPKAAKIRSQCFGVSGRAARSVQWVSRVRRSPDDSGEGAIRPDADATCTGSGYVVDALRSARWAVEAGDYRGTVLRAIRLGNDTDTTACIAGGIAGLIHGIDAIPPRWREGLRGRVLLEPLLQGLLARHARR